MSTITLRFQLHPDAPMPKWIRVLEALAKQHGGSITVTTRSGSVVRR